MNTLKICGFAVLLLTLLLIVKELRREFALPLRLAGGIVAGGVLVLSVSPLVSFFTEKANATALAPYLGILSRSLCVGAVSGICADVCRDCGEGGIAEWVEIAGKIEVLLLSLPLLEEVFQTCTELMGMAG